MPQPAPVQPPEIERRGPSRAQALAVLSLLSLLALALRLAGLGNRSLWIDEISTAGAAALPSLAAVIATIPLDRMPLDRIIAWIFHFLGGGESAVRLPAAILGTLLIPALYLLGSRVCDRRVGLLAALIATLSPFTVWYSQDASPYALFMLLTTLQVWATHRAVERARLPDWLLLALVTALNLMTHYLATLVTIACFAHVGLDIVRLARDGGIGWRQVLTRALGAAVAGVTALLPLAVWAPEVRAFLVYGSATETAKFRAASDLPSMLDALGFGWLAALGLLGLWATRSPSRRLVGIWLGIPLLLMTLGLHGRTLATLPRYLSAEWPAIALLVAAGAIWLADRPPSINLRRKIVTERALGLVGVLLVPLLMLPGLIGSYAEPKDDWRGAAATVIADRGAGSVVLGMGTGSDWVAGAIGYYLERDRSEIPYFDAGGGTDNNATLDTTAAAIRARYGPAWAVFATQTGPGDLRTAARSQTGYYLAVPSQAPGMRRVDLTGVTLIRASSARELLDWGASFIPAVRATAALVAGQPLLDRVLPPPPETSTVHLDSAGPPADRTWTAAAAPATPMVATFDCSSGGRGDARVYVSAHDGGGRWLALYPDNGGYRCQGGPGAFAFALPPATRTVKLWLRVTGVGSGDFKNPAVTVVPAPN